MLSKSSFDAQLGEFQIKFNPSQREFFNAVGTGARYIGFGGGFANGKCINVGSRIALFDGGLKNIEDIQSGDQVLTVDTSSGLMVPNKVKHLIDSGMKEELVIRLVNGLKLATTKEHPYLALLNTKRVIDKTKKTKKPDGTRYDRRSRLVGDIDWRRLEQLVVGDAIAIPIKYPEGNEYMGKELSYLIGVLLGDGSLSTNSSVGLTIGDGYDDFVESIRSVLPEDSQLVKYKTKYAYGVTGTKMGHNPVLDLLRSIDLMGTTSHTKFIPEKFFGATKKEISALISGLIITDGWVDNNYLGYCSVSEQLVDDVQQLFLRIGVLSGKCKKMVKYKGTYRPYYTLQVSDKESIEICNELLELVHKQPKLEKLVEKNKTKVPRGNTKTFRYGDLAFVRIASITPGDTVQMYDLEIENTHNFIANGIVAHNTLAGCLQCLNMATTYKDNLILIGRLHGSDLEASTKKTMLELVAPFLESGQAVYKVKDNKIVFPNKSEIIFRHLEDVSSSGILGMNLGYFYVDQAEEVHEGVFKTLTTRLRRRSYDVDGLEAVRGGILTFNMHGHNWIWRLFKKKWNKDKTPISNPKSYALIEASTLDNKDHLAKDYVDDLMSNTKAWIDRWVHGSWDAFSGQIFEEFSEKIHVIPHKDIDPQDPVFIGIDPGHVDEFAGVFLAILPGGQRYIFDEHYISGQTTKWHADVIKAKKQGKNVKAIYVDAANAQVIADLNAEGIYCIPAKKEVLQSRADMYTGGINMIKEMLRVDDLTQKPGIIISDRCQNLIYELQQYSWKERKGEMNAPEIPEDKHNHAIDALRYIILNYYTNQGSAKSRVIMR